MLTNFFGEGAETLSWGEGRFYVVLPGTPSFPFEGDGARERWIEIYLGTDNIDVMTREMDAYTNVLANGLANGLAKLIARYWQGDLEDGE